MEIEIRQALESEKNILLDFEQGIISAERPFASTLKDDEIHYYDLFELIKSENAEVLVAVIDGEIIDSVYVKILQAKPYLKHIQYAYLGFMYVKPGFRGQGVNLKLLQSLIEWANRKNTSEIRFEVYNENEIAKNAYLKSGFSQIY